MNVGSTANNYIRMVWFTSNTGTYVALPANTFSVTDTIDYSKCNSHKIVKD